MILPRCHVSNFSWWLTSPQLICLWFSFDFSRNVSRSPFVVCSLILISTTNLRCFFLFHRIGALLALLANTFFAAIRTGALDKYRCLETWRNPYCPRRHCLRRHSYRKPMEQSRLSTDPRHVSWLVFLHGRLAVFVVVDGVVVVPRRWYAARVRDPTFLV